MFFEIGLQLLFGFRGVQEELLSRTEGQPTNIAISHTRRGADESHDPHIPFRHRFMIAGAMNAGQICVFVNAKSRERKKNARSKLRIFTESPPKWESSVHQGKNTLQVGLQFTKVLNNIRSGLRP